jgi:hypothetical protein
LLKGVDIVVQDDDAKKIDKEIDPIPIVRKHKMIKRRGEHVAKQKAPPVPKIKPTDFKPVVVKQPNP